MTGRADMTHITYPHTPHKRGGSSLSRVCAWNFPVDGGVSKSAPVGARRATSTLPGAHNTAVGPGGGVAADRTDPTADDIYLCWRQQLTAMPGGACSTRQQNKVRARRKRRFALVPRAPPSPTARPRLARVFRSSASAHQSSTCGV